MTVSPENPVYNGGQQIPSVAVQVGDTILKENDQYQLSYAQMVVARQQRLILPRTQPRL